MGDLVVFDSLGERVDVRTHLLWHSVGGGICRTADARHPSTYASRSLATAIGAQNPSFVERPSDPSCLYVQEGAVNTSGVDV